MIYPQNAEEFLDAAPTFRDGIKIFHSPLLFPEKYFEGFSV